MNSLFNKKLKNYDIVANYHIPTGIANMILCLHKSIEEKFSMGKISPIIF